MPISARRSVSDQPKRDSDRARAEALPRRPTLPSPRIPRWRGERDAGMGDGDIEAGDTLGATDDREAVFRDGTIADPVAFELQLVAADKARAHVVEHAPGGGGGIDAGVRAVEGGGGDDASVRRLAHFHLRRDDDMVEHARRGLGVDDQPRRRVHRHVDPGGCGKRRGLRACGEDHLIGFRDAIRGHDPDHASVSHR